MINMDENLDNPRFEEKSGDLSLSLQEEFFDENYIKLQRYELTKKNTEKSNQPLENNENLNVANYIDLQNATDYFIDEKNMNLSLVPVNETMLFSGIPDPKSRPIPEKQAYFKEFANANV